MLSATDTLELIRERLGSPPTLLVDRPFLPSRLQAAADEVGPGGLVALVADHPGHAAMLGIQLRRIGLDVESVEVDEGVLVLGHRPAPPRRPVVEVQRPEPWSTPDAAPIPGARPTDLDEAALRRLLRAAHDRREVPDVGSNEDRYLGSYGLLALDGRTWRPTVAAMVLAGTRPDLFLPGCALEAEVDGEAFTLRGTLPDILRGLDRPARPLDQRIVREAVANAFLHRDWSSPEPVELGARDCRVEVCNPGRLARSTPNPLLVHLAGALGLVPAEGKGLAGVAARLRRLGLPPHSLFERDGVVRFVVDLPRRRQRPPATPRHLPPPPPMPVPPALPAQPSEPDPPPAPVEPPAAPVPDPPPPVVVPSLMPRDPDHRADAVLAVLRARGQATTREVAGALGCSRPVIGKVLTALVAEGRVRYVAAFGNSPFQAYAVADTPR